MTELVIRSSVLVKNFRFFARLTGGSQHVMPVVKANAYGHGAVRVAKLLRAEKPWGFAVASSAEALELRHAGIRDRLLILSYWELSEARKLLDTRTDFVVWDQASIRQLATLLASQRKNARVHLKVDTGASRIGLLPHDVPAALTLINRFPRLKLVGVFSHFADAEGASLNFTKHQWGLFQKATTHFPPNMIRHISCTASTKRFSAAHADVVRLGIGLYTHSPALSWTTSVLQLKTLPAQTTVGYARTYSTKRVTQLAVLPVGYADGVPRSLSNRGYVLVRGRRRPIIGRVCMNLTMIDVTDAPSVRLGDDATLIGRQGRGVITANDMAEQAGTIDYEILSRLPAHLSRRYDT
jgi:alanine racemase